MIQQLFTVASTLTGFLIGYGFNKIYKKKNKEQYAYPEIEITDYEYTNLWEDI